jgi:hypothetical protein
MAITSVKTGSSFTNLQKYDNFLGPNSAYIPSSFESIATISPSTGTKTVTFSSIPSTYKSLQIRAIARTDNGGTSNDFIFMRINGDTGSTYASHRLDADGTNVGAVGFANSTYNLYGYIPNNGALASTFSGQIIDLIDYASTTKTKTTRFFSGINVNSSSNTQLQLSSGLWNSTAAVTSISFTVANYNFQSGTTFALYGVK